MRSLFWNPFAYNYVGYFKDRIERKTYFFGEIYFPSKSEHNYLIEVYIFRYEGNMVLKLEHPKI